MVLAVCLGGAGCLLAVCLGGAGLADSSIRDQGDLFSLHPLAHASGSCLCLVPEAPFAFGSCLFAPCLVGAKGSRKVQWPSMLVAGNTLPLLASWLIKHASRDTSCRIASSEPVPLPGRESNWQGEQLARDRMLRVRALPRKVLSPTVPTATGKGEHRCHRHHSQARALASQGLAWLLCCWQHHEQHPGLARKTLARDRILRPVPLPRKALPRKGEQALSPRAFSGP